MSRRLLRNLLPFLMLGMVGQGGEVYHRRNTYNVRYNTDFIWRDRDSGRQLRQFSVHGEPVMAYSRKDAIKRWVHADLKNRRRVRR